MAVAVTALIACLPALASAQYFGRNKVQYRTFDFQVLKTTHFDLYYYPEEKDAAEITARLAERWYSRLSRFFGHELRGRQPVILYAVGSHFRQTNAIEGLIDEGTGGVTEPLKRRVVLPVSGSLADTDHVLGHELVHAFQFDLTGADPRDAPGSVPGILEYPLWFVEGMAEYLSLGPVDAQTAMWMRDAAVRNELPDIKDLDDPKFFPYRWGHAFWAYIGAKYGDRSVASLIRSSANPRFDLEGLARQLGTTAEGLNADWHRAIRASAETVTASLPTVSTQPRLLVDKERGGGRFNIGPELSPDGTKVAFFSEKDMFSIDLYIADAETGRILHRLSHSSTDAHFESLEFLNSAGAWSPDGKTLALLTIRDGKPVLALMDPNSGHVAREIKLRGLDDALNPAYAPDGQHVVLSGNKGGLVDLYVLTLATGALEPLTHDPFADLEPTYAPDGKSIVFVTERYSTDLVTLKPGPLRLARIDLATRTVTAIPAFLTGKHLSPQVSADGKYVTFIAEPDGVSNLYRIAIDGGPIERLSAFSTGVAGITTSSPALSASPKTGRLAFSLFQDDGHAIYLLDNSSIVSLVPPDPSDNAAVLPGRTSATGDLARLLADPTTGLPKLESALVSAPYRRKLSLDQVGQPTVSAGVSQFGTFVGGSVSAIFSDMLGDRVLGASGLAGGTTADFGGELLFLNRKHRWNWATWAAQTPFVSGYLTAPINDPSTVEIDEVLQRQINRGGGGLTSYPLSATTRLEFTGSWNRVSFSTETRKQVFDGISGLLLSQSDETVHAADPLYLASASAALVHDSAFYGATSPIYGARFRLEADQSGGSLKYTSVLADFRRYLMVSRPFTIAMRAAHYGRYGADAEDPHLAPTYIGYPDLVHGYGIGSFSTAECQQVSPQGLCSVTENLLGSRLFVANLEVRAPLVGLFRHELTYGRVPVELAAFTDAGVTWTSTTKPAIVGGTRQMVRSYGGAARVNVFGIFILEVAASKPLDRVDRSWQWQVGIREGF